MKFFNIISKLLSSTFIFSTIATSSANAKFNWADYYDISGIEIGENIDPQIGGLSFTKEGKLIACFHRGEVATYDTTTKTWKTFAHGLHEPLGIYVEEEGTILVMQRGEITRLHDKNNDGIAELYEVVSNDWGLTGNYHEFGFGIVKDSKKNIFIALGTASNGSGAREEIRGEWNSAGGLTHENFIFKNNQEWRQKKKKVPRMYARTPFRGCALKIEPGSTKATVYATGLRTPNGLFMDKNDQLWITDNQGDWVGSSKIHRIEEGGFHGHPASLLWSENSPTETPADISPKKLDSMRIKAAALLPQGDAGNSITQPINSSPNFLPITTPATADSAQPLIVGEMNHARLIYYMPDIVNGKPQGASCHILNTPDLVMGNNRLTYSPDGKTLYTGKTHLSWPGQEGIKKITYKGTPYLMAEQVQLTKTGFKFTFNSKITAPKLTEKYIIKSFGNDYHKGYGSKKVGEILEQINSVTALGNTLVIDLKTPPVAGKIYDITLSKKISSELSDISSNRFWYTAHEVYGTK